MATRRQTYVVRYAHTGATATLPLTVARVRALRALGHSVVKAGQREEVSTMRGR